LEQKLLDSSTAHEPTEYLYDYTEEMAEGKYIDEAEGFDRDPQEGRIFREEKDLTRTFDIDRYLRKVRSLSFLSSSSFLLLCCFVAFSSELFVRSRSLLFRSSPGVYC
jgi:hypothetical protein